MKSERNQILERTNVSVIAEFIKENKDLEVFDAEANADEIKEKYLLEIRKTLAGKMGEQDISLCLDVINDYVITRENLYFIYGFRAGAKLYKELSFG